LTRCIYADSDNSNKFNQGDSGLLAQMYLQVSKSGLMTAISVVNNLTPSSGGM
jgi:hypothetical protein